MKPLNTLIFLLLATHVAYGQVAQIDTALSIEKSANVNVYDKDFLRVSKGAENYVISLLGDTFYHKHIQINFRQTKKESFQVYVGKSGDAKNLESHVYYNIHYYVVDKNDTLSYFNLLVDSIGTPTQFDKEFYFSSPTKLILSFENLFSNKFAIDFAKATAIVKQHGFHDKPFLDYQVNDDKEGFYWRVSNKLADGKRRVFDINANTGETKEFYFSAFKN
jgi:hypothetical protein